MSELMRFETSTGSLVVEVGDQDPGYELVDRRNVIFDTKRRLEAVLLEMQEAGQSALKVFREGGADPDEIEVEFGIKLTAQAGAVLAKASTEAHFKVKLTWAKNNDT
ncbi:CU044_2847 family protein [Actinoplanes sp. NPDC026623]|uniref:CU044_2847 family protein n=1 Tax=Actinoplanes sp. NPDC026623 TaxID=3155610 RepID=UPI0033D73161